MVKKVTTVQNEFCLKLQSDFAHIKLLAGAIPSSQCIEIQRFFIGMSILESLATHDLNTPYPQAELNLALRQILGNGNTWHSSLQYLTGARAKAVYATNADIFRRIAGPEFMLFANQALAEVDLNGLIALQARRANPLQISGQL